jgi:hypothetical protein
MGTAWRAVRPGDLPDMVQEVVVSRSAIPSASPADCSTQATSPCAVPVEGEGRMRLLVVEATETAAALVRQLRVAV